MIIYLKQVGLLMTNHPALSEKPGDLRTIIGIISSIIYFNDAITIVKLSFVQGHLKAVLSKKLIQDKPQIGEIWQFTGDDELHVKYGEQFIVQQGFRTLPIDSLIIKYIEYNAPGIGIYRSKKLWSVFGQQIYDLLDNGEIRYLTDKKLGKFPFEIASDLIEKWQTNRIETKIVRFFQESGFPLILAMQALSFYHEETIHKIKENPYRLIAFTDFLSIDKQAVELFGVKLDDPRRLDAAVTAAVYKAYDAGHTAIPKNDLLLSIKSIASISKERAEQAIAQALLNRTIIADNGCQYQGLGQALMEKFIASKIAILLENNTHSKMEPNHKFNSSLIIEFERAAGVLLDLQQKHAIEVAVTQRFAVIDGTKCVGKATCVSALHYQTKSESIIQVAFTLRAAHQMTIATQSKVTTVATFLLNLAKQPLPADTKLIVFEANMIDLPTMIKLIRIIPRTGSVLLVGDSKQLIPNGPGLIFHALSCMPSIPTITLTRVQSTVGNSDIPLSAQMIATLQKPNIVVFNKIIPANEQVGLCHISAEPTDISKISVGLYYFITTRNWGEIQIIAPTVSLCNDINIQLHDSLRQNTDGIMKPLVSCTLNIGLDDKVVCHGNLGYLGIPTGSIGIVTQVFESPIAKYHHSGKIELHYATVEFDGEQVCLSVSDFTQIKLGYCITCSQAQGSEFSRVIIAFPTSQIIDNSWVYSAVTRAKIQSIIIGDIQYFLEHCTTPPKINRRSALLRHIEGALHGQTS